jgi:hypothetical protein
MTLNLPPYAARAEQHWKTVLPQDYAAVPEQDRDAFFRQAGTEIEDRVEARTLFLLAREEQREPPAAGTPRFTDTLALIMSVRASAERQVLAEMLPPPGNPED